MSATVLIADDHSVVIDGLRFVLEPTYTVLDAVADGRALVTAARALRPDVVVADVSMPILNGIEAARQIRQTDERVKIVFFTMHSDIVYASEAFQAGGSAYVLKSSVGTEILTAIHEVLAGRTYLSMALDKDALDLQIQPGRNGFSIAMRLSPRQREVVRMTAEGQSSKQIAYALGISPRTVEFHRYRVMKLLDVHTIAELVQFALKHDILQT